MGSRGRALEKGWERDIPEVSWPRAMLAAIRQDIRALATPRVLETLEKWRETAAQGSNSRAQLEALRFLEELGEALFPEPDNPDGLPNHFDGMPTIMPRDEPTVDAWQMPPKPDLRRDSSVPPHSASDRVQTPRPRDLPAGSSPPIEPGDWESNPGMRIRPPTGESRPPESGFEEDEKPTRAFVIPPPRRSSPLDDPLAAVPEVPWAALPPPGALTEDGGPTHHIALPEEVLKRRLESAEKALFGPDDDDGAPFRGSSSEPKVDDLRLSSPGRRPPSSRSRVRRTAARTPDPQAPRPRAAMHHVRSLYGVLFPFARELVPLSYERRSRRFWARWREVAGDRGVRRPFIEDLLRSATDPRTIVCELIAEVQSVDVDSVYVLADRLEQQGRNETVEAYETPADQQSVRARTAGEDDSR